MRRTEMRRDTPGARAWAEKQRTPLERGTTEMKRSGPLGPGKKKVANATAMDRAEDLFFRNNGWLDEDDRLVAYCQVSGLIIYHGNTARHHKTPRSEMHKAGMEDAEMDAPHRLLICSPWVHLHFLHAGQQGRPTDPVLAERFRVAEESPAHAGNKLAVEWGPQFGHDLQIFLTGQR
jgi:hypothetical protein